MKNGEFSLWSLRVILLAGLQGAVLFKMMGRTDETPLESMFLIRFQTLVFFQPKNGRKWNFLWKNGEFSLWSLPVLVLAGLLGYVISKMMGPTDAMLLESMFLIRFRTFLFFQPKNGRKGNFL